MNMNSRILSQRGLLYCHKYWLNVTHPPAFVARFSARKNRFDAIQPFMPPLPLRSPGALLCCVFFSSFPKRLTTTEKHQARPCGRCGLSPRCPCWRTSSVVTVNLQSRGSGTMIFTGIRKGHAGKTGRLITTRHAAGSVISPGALKDQAKHLRGGKNVTKDRPTAISERIGGDFHSIVRVGALCFTSAEYVMKKKQAGW